MMGWPVVAQTFVRRERWPGKQYAGLTPLVYPGQDVVPDQPIMRLERDLSAAPPGTAPAQQQVGEIVSAGLRGRVVTITERGGVIIESRVAMARGSLGAGGQVAGILTIWSVAGADQEPRPIPPGAILVVPGAVNLALLRRALVSGVAGIVASSISLPDLEGFLNVDFIELLNSNSADTAQSRLPPLTIMLTEGIGAFPMYAGTIAMLTRYQGTIALLSGTTLPRQRLAPDVLISLPPGERWQPVQPDPAILRGTNVRVCGGDHEGAYGVVEYLFVGEQTFLSGLRARAARLRLEDGSALVVPLALIERVN